MKRIASFGITAGFVLALGSLSATAEEPAGKAIFVASKCQSCHSVKAASIATEGEQTAPEPGEKAPPDLSEVGAKHKAEFLKGFLTKKEMLNGKKHMKKFAGTEEDLTKLTDWLLTLKPAK